MKTGPSFREEHVLPCGTRVLLRHILPSDAPMLRSAYEQLSSESRYRRFFGGGAALDDTMLRYLTNVDGQDHVAIVATVESLDMKTERGVGVARFVRSKDRRDTAEIAVVVVDDMHGKGIGSLLLSTAVVAACERGIARFRGEVLADNAPVVAMLEEVGATRTPTAEGTIVFELELERSEPALARMLRMAAEQVATFIRRLAP